MLQENWPEFDSQLNGGVALMKRIKAEEQEVTVLEHELEGPVSILTFEEFLVRY